MNYYDELKALFPPCLFTMFLGKDQVNLKLGYLLLKKDKKLLFLIWYGCVKSTCELHDIPYVMPCDYLNTHIERKGVASDSVPALQDVINQLKNNELQ